LVPDVGRAPNPLLPPLPLGRGLGRGKPLHRSLLYFLALFFCTATNAAQPIRYCDYPVYPPISWSDGHEVHGLAPQTVRSVLGELGYEVQTVVLGNWKRCLLDAAEGRVDVVLAYQTPQRDDGLLFSVCRCCARKWRSSTTAASRCVSTS
jgi:amino acid ABC transporter substrate-binding protein, PAAT family (TC 3.A.1.3.-)